MEKVSALMDGELSDGEAKGQIARLREAADLQHSWDSYHLIGDTLRGDTPLSADFNRRMAERLAQEPTVLAPQRQTAAPARKLYTYAVSAAASVAGVVMVAWVVMSTGGAPTATPQPELAKAVAPATVATAPATALAPTAPAALAAAQPDGSVPNEGQSNEYLLAHQGISPSTAIQGLAPYVRTVSNITQVAPVPR